jgi:hypothetical protein
VKREAEKPLLLVAAADLGAKVEKRGRVDGAAAPDLDQPRLLDDEQSFGRSPGAISRANGREKPLPTRSRPTVEATAAGTAASSGATGPRSGAGEVGGLAGGDAGAASSGAGSERSGELLCLQPVTAIATRRANRTIGRIMSQL